MAHEYEYVTEEGERLFTINELDMMQMIDLCNENKWYLIREVKEK